MAYLQQQLASAIRVFSTHQKEMDEGQALIIKRKVAKKGGGTNPAPKLIDTEILRNDRPSTKIINSDNFLISSILLLSMIYQIK